LRKVKKGDNSLGGREKAVKVAGLALDKKAVDVVVLDVRGMTIISDYFIICSGVSTTQVRAIAEHIEETLGKDKIKPLGVEGLSYCHWVLLDYGDVIVHVFDVETRQYYELEKLWLDAPRVALNKGG
jgi:ribosome-associated protein